MKLAAIILIFLPTLLYSQRSYTLRIVLQDRDTAFLERNYSYRHSFTDTVSRSGELRNMIGKLNKDGFLEAAYTSFKTDSSELTAMIIIGKQWEWASLKNGNVDELILNRIGYREKLFSEKPISVAALNELMESILGYCENNGYPFASVKLDSLHVIENRVEAKIFLEKNVLVTIDSLVIKGTASISKSYLSNYVGLRLPAMYKEDAVQKMSAKIMELPFLTETQSPKVLFSETHSYVTLFLNKKNASRFDFIIGVLPNSQSTGKLLVTGDGTLSLVNSFGKGESIYMRFSKLQTGTTQADLKAEYPYLFNMPFGLDGTFHLYKYDSFYVNIKEQIGVKFLFTGINYLKFFFRNAATNVLSFDSARIVSSKQLPPYLDTRANYYGLEALFQKLDYRNNPSKGWSILASSEAGTRKIKENVGIEELSDPDNPSFEFSSLYDSLDAKETQYIIRMAIDKYWSLSPASSFKTSYHGAAFFSNGILQNELFRIGGFQLLRGFDEESIYASQYHLLTMEYHYLISRNSFFYLFVDGAYVVNQTASPVFKDWPYGFGAGINFETRAGIFALTYALGSQQNNPIQFKSAKLHFGYVNYF